MDITLYSCYSDKEVLNKSLSDGIVFTGSLREQSSIITPSFILEITNPSSYNYVYIPEFNRYYYITDITSIRTGLWLIRCRVDVLMSFRNEILNMGIIINETENTEQETYINGDAWQRLVKTKTDIINFPSGLNDNGEFILVTSGGIPTGSTNQSQSD